MPSPASCMNTAQQVLIRSALRDALAEGHRFKRVVEVKGYLKDAGLSEELISEHIEEIFDCYLDLESQPRIGNAGPSPPPSEGLPVQPSTQTVPGEASADSNGIAPPVFHSDDIINISFFRPRMSNWHPTVAKICEGNVSFISEALVLRQYLGRDKPSIVLSWRYATGSENDKISDTRCVVVKPELLLNCDVALAENCGTEDAESQSSLIDEVETSPTSNTNSVPQASDDIGEHIQATFNAVSPNITQSRYKKVSVLMLSWEDEDPILPVSIGIQNLGNVFEDVYGFETEVWKIPDESCHARVLEKIVDFVTTDGDPTDYLLIVYYTGYAKLTRNRLLSWTSQRNNQKSRCPTVKWSGIQNVLEEAESDVLILLDCCCSGTTNVNGGNGVTELLSACGYNSVTNGVGQYSFTNTLITALRQLSKRPSFTVGELYNDICRRIQNQRPEGEIERNPTPINLILTQDQIPRSIRLSVYRGHADADNAPTAHDSRLVKASTALQAALLEGKNQVDRQLLKSGPDVQTTGSINTQAAVDRKADSDADSASSIFSLESRRTDSTKTTTEGAFAADEPGIDGIVNILAIDEGLEQLYAVVPKMISAQRFRRNFGRLLRQFADDLADEFPIHLKAVPNFIRSHKGTIAERVWETVNGLAESSSDLNEQPIDEAVKNERLNAWLSERLPASATVPENTLLLESDETDSGSISTASSHTNWDRELDETPRYSEILGSSLQGSRAMTNLRGNFQRWILPAESNLPLGKQPRVMEEQSNEPDQMFEKWIKDLIARIAFVPFEHITSASIVEQAGQAMSDRLKASFERYTNQPWDWWPLNAPRKPPSKDVVRLRWQCACGHTRMVDAPLKDLQRPQYRNVHEKIIGVDAVGNPPTPLVSFPQTQAESRSTIPASQAQSNDQSGIEFTSQREIMSQLSSQDLVASITQPSTDSAHAAANNPIRMPSNEFVFLGVNIGYHLELVQIDRTMCSDDGQFFSRLKLEYDTKRGTIRRWLSVKQFHHCEFVLFEKPIARKIFLRGRGYPHDDPAHLPEYHYRPIGPSPPWVDPPVLPDEFYDRYYGCSNCMVPGVLFHRCSPLCPATIERIDRIPKRTQPLELELQGQEDAWGLHAVEYVSTLRVVIYHIVILTGPLIFWCLWLWYWKHDSDLQNATVPLTCMIPLVSMFWALLKGN